MEVAMGWPEAFMWVGICGSIAYAFGMLMKHS